MASQTTSTQVPTRLYDPQASAVMQQIIADLYDKINTILQQIKQLQAAP